MFNNIYRRSAPVDRVKYGVLNIGELIVDSVLLFMLVDSLILYRDLVV